MGKGAFCDVRKDIEMTRQSFCVVCNAPPGSWVLGVGERCVTAPETAHDKLILVDGRGER